MKKQWPLWVFVIAVIIIVLFAFNYQGNQRRASIDELFPEEGMGESSVQYEFVGAGGEKQPVVSPSEDTTMVPSPAWMPASTPVAQKKAAPVVVSRPAPTPVAAADLSGASFTIQVASFKNKTVAQARMKTMQGKGYPAQLVDVNLGEKGTWYRIYVGSFGTKAQAQAYLPKVKADFKDSFIISPK